MSMSTQYTVYNDSGKELGKCESPNMSWVPPNKEEDPFDFAIEVAEILLGDIAVYCSGQQKNAPTPTFMLKDVALLQSAGGSMTRDEFPDALETLAQQMNRIITRQHENLMKEKAEAPPKINPYFTERRDAAFCLAQTFTDIIAARSVSVKKPTPPAITP